MRPLTNAILLLSIFGCATPLSWPIPPSGGALTAKDYGLVESRFNTAYREALGSDSDVAVLTQHARIQLAVKGERIKSTVLVYEIRWLSRDIAIVKARSNYESLGGYDSQGRYHGSSGWIEYLAVFERINGQWQSVHAYRFGGGSVSS